MTPRDGWSPLAALAVLLSATLAAADPVTLRIASVAPDGTAWAREVKAFGREIALATHDGVQVKWYLSGIAGDELQSHERVKRDQLDGILSGGMLCQRLAPSMRAAGMVSEFRDRNEAHYVLGRLKPIIDLEFAKESYVNVATAGMGFSVFFSRSPVRTMADLRKLRPWLWSLDEVLRRQLAAMGINAVPLPVEGSARAYDEGKVDGFVGLPSAALAFQCSSQARYVIDLRVGYLTGCMLIARRAWDMLSHDDQQIVESAAAKLQVRVQETTRQMDESLLSGLFGKQGLQALPVPAALQAEFSAAAHDARTTVDGMVPPVSVERVAEWLAEYRSSHPNEKR
ncbi:MAG: TRAP-type C4-dicarboxylate transport system, substrate-binding protein [bacterium]|nr:TRAP-type C4-dicarboxylate transport system, substrate-binding protein [bacterium]